MISKDTPFTFKPPVQAASSVGLLPSIRALSSASSIYPVVLSLFHVHPLVTLSLRLQET
jgi:hypothetical protein